VKKNPLGMAVVTHSELEAFIGTYLSKFSALTANLSPDQKYLILPRYLSEKCDIIGTISRTKGVSLKFVVREDKQSSRFEETDKPIGDEVLPMISVEGKHAFLILDGENMVLQNVNLITKEFYDNHSELVDKLTRATNLIMDEPKRFVEVVSGDLKLIDCSLAFCKDGKDFLDRIDCLWLFSSNQSSDFHSSKAEFQAIEITFSSISVFLSILEFYSYILDRHHHTSQGTSVLRHLGRSSVGFGLRRPTAETTKKHRLFLCQ